MIRIQLTENFFLDEFLVSQTAARHGIDMGPPDYVVENLRRLCMDVLQPARTAINRPFMISSGYRPEELNRRIGGSRTSAHIQGRAADFRVSGLSPYEAAVWIRDLRLPYDQLIHEFGQWIHVGIAPLPAVPREQDLTASRLGGVTHYQHGIVQV